MVYKAKVIRRIDKIISKVNCIVFRILIRINHAKNSNLILKSVWCFVNRHYKFFSFRKHTSCTNYPQDWRNHVYIDLLISMKRHYQDFCPEVIIHGEDIILDELKRGTPTVFLGIHSRLSTSFYVLFERYKIKWAVISAYRPDKGKAPYISSRANLFGITTPLNLVPNSRDSLLLVRRLIRDNTVICCAPDYKRKDIQVVINHVYISPGIFEFCLRLNTLMVYAIPTVLENATIDLNLSSPRRAREFETADEIIADFTKYVESVTKLPRNWIVQKRNISR